MSLSRRALLSSVVAGAASSSFSFPDFDAQRPKSGRRPKNIIFCVADGMAVSVVTAIDHLRQLNEGKRSYWAWLYDQPFVYNGLQSTRSLNSLVTDSSAASSSWGSGVHIWNGMTNTLPDKTNLRPLSTLMAEKGVKCGLVTSTTITHATPSGFAVNCLSRDYEWEIAESYLKSGVDVLLGGGDKFFSAKIRKDKKDVYADFAQAGFGIVKTRDQLLASSDSKLLGIFSSSHLPYMVDYNNDPALQQAVPTLAEMSRHAIGILSKTGRRNGFVLQIEGGRVDHGNHSNDAQAALFDQIAFEEAVQVAIEFAMQDKETLVIVTSDHACGGIALNGAGDEYSDSTEGLKMLNSMKASFSPLLMAIGTSRTPQRVQEVFEHKLSVKLTAEEADAIVGALHGKFAFGTSEFYRSVNGTMGMVLGNHTKITFTSSNHTSDHVLVTAFGPGSEACAGLTQNIEFFDLMTRFKGVKHRNPTMSFADAIPHYEKLQKELNAGSSAFWQGEEDDVMAMNHGYGRAIS